MSLPRSHDYAKCRDYTYMLNPIPRSKLNIESVEQLLQTHAQTRGDATAIIAVGPDRDNSIHISYKELYALTRRTASFLMSLGITRGDRFAILMHNTPEVLLFELAGALIGATTVPLDGKRDTLERKLFKLKDTSAKMLFIQTEDASVYSEIEAIQQSISTCTVHQWSTFAEFKSLLTGRLTGRDPVNLISSRSYSREKMTGSRPVMKGTLEDFSVILYTSGTTALPKGVLLSLRACLLNAMGIIAWQKFTSADRFNIVLPLHHVNSTEFCLSMLLVGGTIILNESYSASKFWQTVSRFKATNTSIVPTILHDLLVRHDEFVGLNLDISSLKRICIGSAPVLPEETLRFYETFNIRVVQGYGQTETALRVAGVPIDVDQKTYRELVKSSTIGTELSNNHLAIMDKNNNEMKEGEYGEICIAGPILADGYLNNPEETAKSFKNGWFHSGDLGYWKTVGSRPGLEPRKFFFIIGRIKEIIIKGGVNISPSAIEDALLKKFPQIDEVSVVGYPDERMGEEIAAVIVLKRSHLASQGETLRTRILDLAQNGTIPGLSIYESPKKVFIFENLPKTSTGKIQRVEVKRMVADLIKKETQKHYYARKIDPSETDILKIAVGINNARFQGLPSILEEFSARAQNGLVFGVFEEKEGLVGSLSCVQLSHESVETLETWKQATNNGTLSNNDPTGDTLLCIAISVKSQSPSSSPLSKSSHDEESLRQLAKKFIKDYVKSGNDHVLEFHRKPKGGLPGATVWKILENGRPDDKESMGYNVLMKYPEISKGTKIIRSNASSPSILLIEHALLYAKEHSIKEVIAFSRPVGFRKFLTSKRIF